LKVKYIEKTHKLTRNLFILFIFKVSKNSRNEYVTKTLISCSFLLSILFSITIFYIAKDEIFRTVIILSTKIY